jgi:hypothetical protein
MRRVAAFRSFAPPPPPRAAAGWALPCPPPRRRLVGDTALRSTSRTHGHARRLRLLRRRGEPRLVRAFLLARGLKSRGQEHLYRELFARIGSFLPQAGRFYLQTMAFGRNMIAVDDIYIDAPRDSDAWHLALMERQFPGGRSCPWARSRSSAPPSRTSVSSRASAVDSTTSRPSASGGSASPNGASRRRSSSSALPRWLRSADFRLAFTPGVSPNRACFEGELLDHHRLVFEKR